MLLTPVTGRKPTLKVYLYIVQNTLLQGRALHSEKNRKLERTKVGIKAAVRDIDGAILSIIIINNIHLGWLSYSQTDKYTGCAAA